MLAAVPRGPHAASPPPGIDHPPTGPPTVVPVTSDGACSGEIARHRCCFARYGDDVDRDAREWMDRGLYDPDAPEAPDRLATLRYLAARGATTDDLAAPLDHGPTAGGLDGLARELPSRLHPRITLP